MSSNRKKERRLDRHNRNIINEANHKKEAWDNGKLIEENHNQGPYTSDYTRKLSSRLVQYINDEKNRAINSGSDFVMGFRKYKIKIQDLILHWNNEVPKTKDYEYLKRLLEVYWDEVILLGNDTALLGVQW